MLYVYYYRSTNGSSVPSAFVGDLAILRASFNKSQTPILSLITISTSELRDTLLIVLETQLTTVSPDDLGLAWCLRRTVHVLREYQF